MDLPELADTVMVLALILILLGLVSRIPLGSSPIAVVLTVACLLLSVVSRLVFIRVVASLLSAFFRM